MSSLHNDIATWAGKARARGQDRIEILVETADELSEALMQRAVLLAACQKMMPVNISVTNKNIPDDTMLPMDVTMGELRTLYRAIEAATGNPNAPENL